MKYAVIDIGSNSVRLMLWADGTLYKKLFTTRLAARMRNGLLADDAIRRTAEAVAACFEEGVREAGRGNTFAFATAAVRTAVNGEEFCGLVKKLCGLTIDVVAGETEALLGALGAVGSGDGGMVDIGGASTEVFVRENGAVKLAVSLPVGVVRLKDGCGQDGAALVKEVSRCVSPLLGKKVSVPMFAVGGTACTLACLFKHEAYSRAAVHGVCLTRAWVEEETGLLLSLPVDARKQLIGMEEKRADVIAGGAVLLGGVMDALSLREIAFSDEDNLEGYLRYRGLIC